MYNKDFDSWNRVKKEINKNKRIAIRNKCVWICSFGLNIGYEIDGKKEQFERPCLVIKSFGEGGGIVLPLTSKDKKGKYLIILNTKSRINITQIRYLDSKRFKRFLFEISNSTFENIIKKVKEML
jgi:mRNA interferase MazF